MSGPFPKLDPYLGTYAPNFRVTVDGQELDAASKGDVLDLKVTLDGENLSGFEMSLNNWDDRKLTFKYTDFGRLNLLKLVRIEMGYATALVPMIEGYVTALSPQFPDGGPPTVGVSGQDKMFRLKRSKPPDGTPPYKPNTTDSEIAADVARRHGLTAITDLGPRNEAPVYQKDQDDATFLMARAKRIKFEVYVQTDPQTKKDALYFVKRGKDRAGQPVPQLNFRWGRNLISFTPRLNLSDQVTSVTVRGWNPVTKKHVEATADANSLDLGGDASRSGPAILAALGGKAKNEVVVDDGADTEEKAKQLATALLVERSQMLVEGSAKVIGTPALRPGCAVNLSGLGSRFDGDYYVKKATHSIGGSGYLTEFEVERPTDGPVKGG